jgi:hypothetical protein
MQRHRAWPPKPADARRELRRDILLKDEPDPLLIPELVKVAENIRVM